MFILKGLEGLNQKRLENRPPLKFDFTYWEGVSALLMIKIFDPDFPIPIPMLLVHTWLDTKLF